MYPDIKSILVDSEAYQLAGGELLDREEAIEQPREEISFDSRMAAVTTEIKFPIAETFVSPQGEGLFTGTMMQFIRFAGCSVGQPLTQDEKTAFNVLNNYQTKCTTWDSREFICDTNYKVDIYMTAKEIGDLAKNHGMKRICLTGGEPLMHKNIGNLIRELSYREFKIHIETSGTIPLRDVVPAPVKVGSNFINFNSSGVWIAVSPKKGYLPQEILKYADEVKVLIDENVTEESLRGLFDSICGMGRPYCPMVWLQPINNEKSLDMDNVKRCLVLMQKYPCARLSIQLHKVIGVR